LWRARAYLLKGDVAKAHADATQVISLLEKPAGGHTLRGLAYELAGQLDDALTDHETAIKLDPTLGWAYANRGRVRDAKGERERAAADFAAALQHDPSVPWTCVFYGSLFERAGNMERALVEYEFALKLDPKALSAIKGRDRSRARATMLRVRSRREVPPMSIKARVMALAAMTTLSLPRSRTRLCPTSRFARLGPLQEGFEIRPANSIAPVASSTM
jgi:tetratricopeptide (TPR) repeat protein